MVDGYRSAVVAYLADEEALRGMEASTRDDLEDVRNAADSARTLIDQLQSELAQEIQPMRESLLAPFPVNACSISDEE